VIELIISDYFIPVLIALCMLGVWFVGRDPLTRERYQRAVLRAAISVGIANLAVLISNEYYFRDRPFDDLDIQLLFYPPTDSSFPANPTAVAFAMALGMGQAHWKLGLTLCLVGSIWGLARVYGGVFYLSDIVAGAIIGIAVSYLVRFGLKGIEPIPTWFLRFARTVHLA